MTLKELYDNHPEWHDLPLAVLNPVGEMDFVDHGASVFEGEDEEGKVVVFSRN